jgi:hypothetical protein
MKDATLGGYLREHERPPAFEGLDGDSYTVEIITDRPGPGDGGPWCAYLFFLRWQGQQPVGHVESDYLAWAGSEEEARAGVERLTLREVKDLLDKLVTG